MFAQTVGSVASSFMFSFLPFLLPLVLFAVMTWMIMVISPNRVPVMIGKSKDDRCWNNYSHRGFDNHMGLDYDRTSVMATTMMAAIMYHAPRRKDGGQK